MVLSVILFIYVIFKYIGGLVFKLKYNKWLNRWREKRLCLVYS